MSETPLGPLTVPTTRFGLYTSICIYGILHTFSAIIRTAVSSGAGSIMEASTWKSGLSCTQELSIDSKSQNNLFHSEVELLPVDEVRCRDDITIAEACGNRQFTETHLGLFDHAGL